MTRILIVLCFLVFSNTLFAQPEKAEKKIVNGKEYYVHTVEEGNTLWGIHSLYKVPVKDIMSANPGVENNLSIGQKILIPTGNVVEEPKESNTLKEYDIHTVVSGETAFGIARKYNVKASELLALNPEAKNGLSIGQKLKIPGTAKDTVVETKPLDKDIINGNEATENKVVDKVEETKDTHIIYKDSLVKHTVQKKETLYSLSKRYMVSIQDIKDANDGLTKGLKKGDIINIPLKRLEVEEVVVKEVPEINIDTISAVGTLGEAVFKNKYKVALLVPFMLDENEKRELNRKPTQEREIFGHTKVGLDFYKGVKLALDSLSKAGLNVDLQVFDTANDTAKVNSILKKKEMQDVDLIIGPFASKNAVIVGEFAKKNKIHIVGLTSSNKFLFKNPYASKVLSSTVTELRAMAKFVAEKHHNANIILVNSKIEKESYYYEAFKSALEEELAKYPARTGGDLNESYIERSKINHLTSKVKTDLPNIIIAPSKNRGFVSNLLTRLNGMLNSRTHFKSDVTLFGLDDWEKITNLEHRYKQKVNLHYATTSNVRYDSTNTKELIKQFRTSYGTDPGKYGFIGFDVAYNYLAALKMFGSNLPNSVEAIKSEGVNMRFEIKQVQEESGFENNAVYILKYSDFQLLIQN